jgi:hypothetical protein
VAVTLDVPDAVPEGRVLLVRVRTDPADPRPVRGGEVTLLRTVAYRYRQEGPDGGTHLGTARRAEYVTTQPLPPAGPAPGAYDAEVLLPIPGQGPASADTELVTVDWAVRARLSFAGGSRTQAVRKVAVLTKAARLAAVLDRPPRTEDRGHAVVAIDRLSSRRITPGARLTGDVVLAPLHAGPFRSVRLELLLCEHVPRDAVRCPRAVGSKDTATVIRGRELAAGFDVGPDLAPLRLPFTLDIPDTLPAPTMAEPDFEICWALRAVASRPLHRDASVELSLLAATVSE